MSRWSLGAGVGLLAAVWLGPLPSIATEAFWAHMTIHMVVVAVAAPLIAAGLGGSRFDPSLAAPALFAPVPASIAELLIVWVWHAPMLHEAARASTSVFILEQASFFAAGLLLWSAALGGGAALPPGRAAAGVGALLFTSIHMTLLGAIFALTPRPLYGHAHDASGHTGDGLLMALADQHLGGAIMLLVGGASYLTGALWLLVRLLRPRQQPVPPVA